MVDGVAAEQKTRSGVTFGREVYITNITNPTNEEIQGYHAYADPQTMNQKSQVDPLGMKQLLLTSGEGAINTGYLMTYKSGQQPLSLVTKVNVPAGGVTKLVMSTSPPGSSLDLGPIIDITEPSERGLDDNARKIAVMDLSNCDPLVMSNATYGSASDYLTVHIETTRSCAIMYPVNARKIVKDSTGVLYLVISSAVSGDQRIMMLTSVNGGETWTTEIIDQGGESGVDYTQPAITVDKNNGIHVLMNRVVDNTHAEIYYLYKELGRSWATRYLLAGTNIWNIVGSILVDDSMNIHVVYSDDMIKYRKYDPTTGWGGEEGISSGGMIAHTSTLDIGKDGIVHIAWQSVNLGVYTIKYRYGTSGSWSAIETIDTAGYISNIIVDGNGEPHITYRKPYETGTDVSGGDVYYCNRVGGTWNTPVNLTPGKDAGGYSEIPGQISMDNKGGIFIAMNGTGYGTYLTRQQVVYRYRDKNGNWYPDLASDAEILLGEADVDQFCPRILWHLFPKAWRVYQNLPVSGIVCIFLQEDITLTTTMADVHFYGSPTAIVGDVGQVGEGGDQGVGTQNPLNQIPTNETAQSALQIETIKKVIRGYIGKSNIGIPHRSLPIC